MMAEPFVFPVPLASEPALQSAKNFLETQIRCEFIEIESDETPVFVDCGGNLERISCPECGANLILFGGERLWTKIFLVNLLAA